MRKKATYDILGLLNFKRISYFDLFKYLSSISSWLTDFYFKIDMILQQLSVRQTG